MRFLLVDRGGIALPVGPQFPVITDGNTLWYVKHKHGSVNQHRRDRLSYLLGREFANIAEVELLTEQDYGEVVALTNPDDNCSPEDTWLVRVGESYTLPSLICQTPDVAVARELVFSTWIRRRDAHVDNRVYVDGVPVFFDSETAFLGERHLADIGTFFTLGWDHGYAGRWRVHESPVPMDTATARSRPKEHWGACHYVTSVESFLVHLRAGPVKLTDTLGEGWEQVVAGVGFGSPESQEIIDFLNANLVSLETDLNQLEDIVLRV